MNHDKLYRAIEEVLETEYDVMFDRPDEELEAFLDELDTQARVEQTGRPEPIENEEE